MSTEVSRIHRGRSALVLLLLLLTLAVQAWGDTLQVLNATRKQDCGVASALLKDRRLQSAAAEVARGTSPHDAARAAGYPAVQLAMIHLEGYQGDALRRVLGDHYCKLLGDAQFKHVGIAQRRDALWILVAAARGDPGDAATTRAEVLRLVNVARSTPRRCGSKSFPSAAALQLNATLTTAAQQHSDDMAQHSYMDHVGHDGSTPAQRVSAQRYAWRSVGENVAAGAGNAAEVVADWLGSAGHCANIMSAAFTEMGLAFAINSHDDYGVYWTQVFARPRR